MKRTHCLILLLLFLAISCNKSKETTNDNNTITYNNGNNISTPVDTYIFNNELTWSDEFDEDGSVSLDKWTPETIPPVDNCCWYNGEFQFYTDKSDNLRIEDGILKITAKKENFNGKEYTSARLNTMDKFEFTYGKVEVRAKIPYGEGLWPAIWLLGANELEVGWPMCGEMDILEHGDWLKESTVDDPGLISSAVHYHESFHLYQYENLPNSIFGPNPNGHFVRGETVLDNPFDDFHVFSIQWSPKKIEFFVDGNKHHEFPVLTTNGPFNKPFFILLNLAVGGHFTDYYIDPNFTESTFEIDYVRIYQ
jgi:beta-glucanase (GH16 family)